MFMVVAKLQQAHRLVNERPDFFSNLLVKIWDRLFLFVTRISSPHTRLRVTSKFSLFPALERQVYLVTYVLLLLLLGFCVALFFLGNLQYQHHPYTGGNEKRVRRED